MPDYRNRLTHYRKARFFRESLMPLAADHFDTYGGRPQVAAWHVLIDPEDSVHLDRVHIEGPAYAAPQFQTFQVA